LLIAAGTETTAWVQSAIIFHILSDHEVLRKLLEELKRVMPETSALAPFKQLETLPYLISSFFLHSILWIFGCITC
jgi:cytochrome P450